MTKESLQWEAEVKEAQELFDRLTEKDVERFGLKYISRLALEARRLMVKQTLKDHQQITGRLRNSIDIFIVGSGMEIGPTVHYAKWVYEGWSRFAGTKTHLKTYDQLLLRAPRIGLRTAREFLSDEVE